MNITELRAAGRDTLHRAEISPYRVTLCYLLILYAVLVCYNTFSIWYTYKIEAFPGGFDAIRHLNRYYTWVTVGPILAALFSGIMDGAYTGYTVAVAKNPAPDSRPFWMHSGSLAVCWGWPP